MSEPDDLAAMAREVMDGNRYMTLATAEELTGSELERGIAGYDERVAVTPP
jgi:hypothetical protein